MRTQEGNTETNKVISSSENVQSRHSYHELSDVPVVEVDLIESLHRNIAQLTDLQNRMNFVMREIRYLMKL